MTESQLKRLNKAQLVARVIELQTEVDALYVQQRPSRSVAQGIEERRFFMHGVEHVKTRPVGAKVWTIRPVQ